jgi:hypothetical protein
VPCHHSLDQYLDAWIAAAGIGGDKKRPLFRSFKKGDKLTHNPMIRSDVLYMIKRRAKGAALPLYVRYLALKCSEYGACGVSRPAFAAICRWNSRAICYDLCCFAWVNASGFAIRIGAPSAKATNASSVSV